MSDIIYLCVIDVSEDEIGNREETITTKNKVYATIKDVMSYEYYNALASNKYKLEFGVEIYKKDYNNQEIIEYNNELYTVVRKLIKNKDKITLLVEKRCDSFGEQED